MEENQKSNFIEEDTRNEMREDSFWNKRREIPSDSLDKNLRKKNQNSHLNNINIRESELRDILQEQK